MADRIVEVQWEDSNSCHGWHREEDLPKILLICSVGGVVRDDEEGILLKESWPKAPMQDGQKPYGCTTAIPRSAIRKVTELRRGR